MGTVPNVLNNLEKVSQATIARVSDPIARLGFTAMTPYVSYAEATVRASA